MNEPNVLVHEKEFEIAWGDMDALGHVNNVRYFDYFQEARVEWLHSIGLDLYQQEGPILLQVNCTFLKPIIYPAKLHISSRLHSLGRSSMCLDHEIFQAGLKMAEGTSKIVWVNYEANKSVPLPDKIRAILA